MLYQLGILTILESIGHSILPAAICLSGEKEEKEFAAKMSAKAYKKLHEISLKGLPVFLALLHLLQYRTDNRQMMRLPI